MITEKLGIDKRDVEIINLYMKNPQYSQSEIAQLLKLSQPSINSRITKLRQKGLLSFNSGMSYNNSNLALIRIDFASKNPKETVDTLKNCTFFVNSFFTSGKTNVSLFIACEDIKKGEEIINRHLRTNPNISEINMTVMISSEKEFLINIDLSKEVTSKHCYKENGCDDCKNGKNKKNSQFNQD
jgi:Lrp/AsnC family transcriptional regulator, leucine-responsive regulatory protein